MRACDVSTLLRVSMMALALGAGLSLGAITPAMTAEDEKEEIVIPPGFEAWKERFRTKALNAGITERTFDLAFDGVEPTPKAIERNRSQPEFVRPVWSYLDSAVSETRVKNGKAKYAKHYRALKRVEDKYGVPARVIVAIWGLESSYGAILGSDDVIASLATLAYQGRRQKFGERELMAALKILQAGDTTRDGLKGSWAGAMGHTQFIPSTFLEYAVDANGDGKRNIWGDLEDVFASTANYLSRHKWDDEYIWGREVVLPRNFDFAKLEREKSLRDWRKLGVTRVGGVALPQADITGRVIVPGGHQGPAFLLYDNFDVIMKYNRATSYALGIGLLSDRIVGKSGVQGAWPRHLKLLKLSERKELQTRLNKAGYGAGTADGIIGANTRRALRTFQLDNDLPADGFASSAVLDALRKTTR